MGFFDFANFGLQYLAIIALRQHFNKPIGLWPLEPGHVGQAIGIDTGFAQIVPRLTHQVGNNHFAPVRVWPSDHTGLRHLRHLQQHFFYLARIDIGTAGNDQVL